MLSLAIRQEGFIRKSLLGQFLTRRNSLEIIGKSECLEKVDRGDD